MFTSIEQFKRLWTKESDNTRKIMAGLSDTSLDQSVAEGHRSLGRIAWHIVSTIPEMAEMLGLSFDGPGKDASLPKTAGEIKESYALVASSLLEQVTKNWSDKTLKIEDDLFGEKWQRGATLRIMIDHEIHHRGQMTVLMRQAGLKVAGLYGPSREEWATYGMKEPKI